MKNLVLSMIVLVFVSEPLLASTNMTCRFRDLSKSIGETVLVEDTKPLRPGSFTRFEGKEPGGSSSFSVMIHFDGTVILSIKDEKNDVDWISQVDGVDVTKHKMQINGLLSSKNLRPLMIQCIGN